MPDKLVEVKVPEENRLGFVNNKRINWRFAFNGILEQSASQDEVFERVAQPVVDSVMEGFNGTIFAYGQTGSGKTYTLTGGVDAYAERGIIPRTLSEVFRAIELASSEAEHTVRISYLEIYNESGFDLLDPRQGGRVGPATLAGRRRRLRRHAGRARRAGARAGRRRGRRRLRPSARPLVACGRRRRRRSTSSSSATRIARCRRRR